MDHPVVNLTVGDAMKSCGQMNVSADKRLILSVVTRRDSDFNMLFRFVGVVMTQIKSVGPRPSVSKRSRLSKKHK